MRKSRGLCTLSDITGGSRVSFGRVSAALQHTKPEQALSQHVFEKQGRKKPWLGAKTVGKELGASWYGVLPSLARGNACHQQHAHDDRDATSQLLKLVMACMAEVHSLMAGIQITPGQCCGLIQKSGPREDVVGHPGGGGGGGGWVLKLSEACQPLRR